MKLTFTLASVLLLPVAVPAQPSPSTNEAERTVAPRSVSSELPASQAVRVTVVPARSSPGPRAATPGTQPTAPATEREPLPELASPLAWTSPVLSLREIPITPSRRSRGPEAHGVFARAARSSSPGFTGFLLGFSNLLNPFAPPSAGVETSGENWYDGSVRSNPLPWGLRDERFHEPQTPEFSTELSRLLNLGGEPKELRENMPVIRGPLLTNVP